jgi:hypothetical protein
MDNEKVIFESKLTVGDLMDQINYMRDDEGEATPLTELQCSALKRQIEDVIQAVIEDFVADIDN